MYNNTYGCVVGSDDCPPEQSDVRLCQPPPAPDVAQSVVRRLEFIAPPRKTSTNAGIVITVLD